MATALSNNIIDSYLALLKHLNPKAKLDLIAKLTLSLQNDLKQDENLFESAFGAWQGDETAKFKEEKANQYLTGEYRAF